MELCQISKRLDVYIFIAFVLVSFALLIVAEISDYWYEIDNYGKSHQGLWRICYEFTKTNTEVCVKLDQVEGMLLLLPF